MADLIDSLNGKGNIRGITLNMRCMDLCNIIEQYKSNQITEIEAIEQINSYLNDILQSHITSKELEGLSTSQKVQKLVNDKTDIPQDDDKKAFSSFLNNHKMEIRANWSTQKQLESLLRQELSGNEDLISLYTREILELKKYFAYESHGILTFLVDENGQTLNPDAESFEKSKIDETKVFQKVEALYDYIVGSLENGEPRFNRLTLDGQGKFGTVAGVMDTEKEASAKPENYNLAPLMDSYEFAKAHDMDVYINAIVFFKDFPDRLVGGTKEQYETALLKYGEAIASVVEKYKKEGVSTSIDLFNEFVDYHEPFLQRTNNWMSKLSIDDLCKIAVQLKAQMPDTDFGYNDWNFENPQKRESIFSVIRQIRDYEERNGCKILDHIGTQCHTSINDKDELEKSINDLIDQNFGLPIDITELDISRELNGIDIYQKDKDGKYVLDEDGKRKIDYEKVSPEELAAIRKYEKKLQIDIMKMLSQFVKDGKIRCITVWSITDELCCDFCEGKQASVIKMSYDEKTGEFSYSGKGMDEVIEMSEQEMKLIEHHQQSAKKRELESINSNPIQDYCYHTHTERCGHAAKDTSDREFIENAIQGGIKKVAFTDHIPMPDGLNKIPNSRMNIAEFDSYLLDIEHFRRKKEYAGKIEIESGVEFEYAKEYKGVDYLAFLKKMKDKTDKMILGQHWVVDKKGKQHEIGREKDGTEISDDILDLYVESICNAIENNLPNIIAHPDLFMKARDSFGAKEQEAARIICQAAIKRGIPLEINFGAISKYNDSKQTGDEIRKDVAYPSQAFWKYIAEIAPQYEQQYGKQLKVLFGKDAHFPGQLSTNRDYELAIDIVGIETLEQLHFVKDDLKTIDTEMIDKLNRLKEKNNPTVGIDETDVAKKRQKAFLGPRKINTQGKKEARQQVALDQRTMMQELEQGNGGYNNYRE